MDTASVLEEYLADITNLPGDLAFILDEIKVKDEKLLDAQKRIQQRDGAIQKFVKTNGASVESPKEQSSYPRIRTDYQECISLQQEKNKLAVMGLYLVSKHVSTLDSHVKRLEAEGQLAPMVPEADDSLIGASISPEPTSTRPRKSMSDTTARSSSRIERSRDRTPTIGDSRSSSHSRASSMHLGSNPSMTKAGSNGSNNASQGGNAASASGKSNGSSGAQSAFEDSQRHALEVNGARLSLKRNYQSPRQRPTGLEERDEAFCYCKKGSVGNMIACDGDSCEIEWFHWDCVGLTEDPKGSWYCPQCSEKLKKHAK